MLNTDSLPLVEAVQKETGYRPHLSTVLRWCLKPNRYGNILESWMVGGRRMTSVDAVQRYNAANTAQAAPSVLRSEPSATATTASHRRAVQALEAEGL